MARGVFTFLTDRLPDPLFELGLRQVVVVDPAFVPRVVRRIDVDALDSAGVGGEQGLQSDEVVALDNKVAVEPGLLALAEGRQLGIELKNVVRDSVVILTLA